MTLSVGRHTRIKTLRTNFASPCDVLENVLNCVCRSKSIDVRHLIVGPSQSSRPTPQISRRGAHIVVTSGTIAGAFSLVVLMCPFICMPFSQSRLFVRHAEAALLGRRIPVGVLDLDVFGPSVPILQGLQHTNTLPLTSGTPILIHILTN